MHFSTWLKFIHFQPEEAFWFLALQHWASEPFKKNLYPNVLAHPKNGLLVTLRISKWKRTLDFWLRSIIESEGSFLKFYCWPWISFPAHQKNDFFARFLSRTQFHISQYLWMISWKSKVVITIVAFSMSWFYVFFLT